MKFLAEKASEKKELSETENLYLKTIEDLKAKYDAKDPELSSYEATGASNERFTFLLKQFKFKQ